RDRIAVRIIHLHFIPPRNPNNRIVIRNRNKPRRMIHCRDGECEGCARSKFTIRDPKIDQIVSWCCGCPFDNGRLSVRSWCNGHAAWRRDKAECERVVRPLSLDDPTPLSTNVCRALRNRYDLRRNTFWLIFINGDKNSL